MVSPGPEPRVTESKLREEIQEQSSPFVTASDMAASLEVSRQTSYKHLQRMHENGEVEKKKIGSSAVIWWIPKSDS